MPCTRHVEPAVTSPWIAGLFDASYPPPDASRQNGRGARLPQRSKASSAAHGSPSELLVISQLADELDRSTLDSRYESSWCSGVRNDSAPVDSSDENRRSGSEALILKLMS